MNDVTKPSAGNADTTSVQPATDRDVMDLLDDLYNEQVVWSAGVYNNANSQLIQMLAKALRIYALIKDDGDKRKELTVRLKAAEMTVNNGTSLTVRIVRWVFRTDARCFAYARVLRNAVANGIEPEGLPAWVQGLNGVEGAANIKMPKKAATTEADTIIDEVVKKLKAEGRIAKLNNVPKIFDEEGNDHQLVVALLYKTKKPETAVVVHVNASKVLCDSYLKAVSKSVLDESDKPAGAMTAEAENVANNNMTELVAA